MELILLERIKGLGNLGDTVKVKAGFGRNYLLPQEKAVVATPENVKYFESRRAELEKLDKERYDSAKARADSLNELTITISAKASEEGKLYGSVGILDIAEEIKKQNIEINKQEIILPKGPFRAVGDYEVDLHLLHSDLISKINLKIVSE